MNKQELTAQQKAVLAELSYEFIDAASVNFDWSVGYCETWDLDAPDFQLENGRSLIEWRDRYAIEKGDYDDADDLRQLLSEKWQEDGNEPMMNYYTNIDSDASDDIANKFLGTCFTTIRLLDEDKTVLALTGGGMDMTWAMCRAFIKAGYFPPAYLCNLPGMAGEYDLLTISACNMTLEAKVSYYRRSIEHNNQHIREV